MSGPTPEPGSTPTPEGGASEPPSPAGSGPLPPDASMEDILARVRALNAATPEPPPPDATTPGTTAPDGGSVDPASPPVGDALSPSGGMPPAGGLPNDPIGWSAPPAQPRKPSRGRLIAGIGAAFAVIVGLGGKLLLGLAVAGVGSQVLGSLFGGPFEKLPQATRDGFEQRLNAALGPDADKLSAKEYGDRYNQHLVDGLSRLDDGPLIAELQYLAKMFDRADVAACAAAARSELASTEATFELSDIMWSQLTEAELTAHIDTQVRAIEYSAAGAPAQFTVTEDQAGPAVDAIFAALDAQTNSVLDDLANGTERTDAEACSAGRALHDAEVALPQAQLAIIARFTASP